MKIEQIKRIVYLEGKIQEIASKYPESKNFDKAKKLRFYSKNMDLLGSEHLTIEDWEYLNLACVIPFEEMQQELSKYDISSPKIDELKFIEDLMIKYDVSKDIICSRIKQVRKIIKTQKQQFTVLAVPCDRAFVVSPDKTEAFLNVKPDPEIRRQQEEMAEIFRRNILVEDEPKVKKKGKKLTKNKLI